MSNTFSAFNNFTKLMSKSSDNGTEQVCMEVCGSLCDCGPDPCVCPKDGSKEWKVGFITSIYTSVYLCVQDLFISLYLTDFMSSV